MKLARFLALPLLVVPMILAIGVQRTSADPRDFTLINGTANTTFTALYVSPSSASDWQDDVLGRDVLLPGESINITFGRFNPSTCVYDIMVTGKDGSTGELDGVDLCSTTTVTFNG